MPDLTYDAWSRHCFSLLASHAREIVRLNNEAMADEALAAGLRILSLSRNCRMHRVPERDLTVPA